MLAVAVVSTTRALAATRQGMERRLDQATQARHALETIVAALRNVRRDPTRRFPVVIGRSGGAGNDRIDLLVTSDIRCRPDGAESDQYEQSFYLAERSGGPGLALVSRKDHALDEHPQEGGIGTVIAEGIVAMSFQYYSGAEWRDEWPELEPRPPRAVRITLAAIPADAANRGGPADPVLLSTVVALRLNEPTEDRAQESEKKRQEGPKPGGPPP